MNACRRNSHCPQATELFPGGEKLARNAFLKSRRRSFQFLAPAGAQVLEIIANARISKPTTAPFCNAQSALECKRPARSRRKIFTGAARGTRALKKNTWLLCMDHIHHKIDASRPKCAVAAAACRAPAAVFPQTRLRVQ